MRNKHYHTGTFSPVLVLVLVFSFQLVSVCVLSVMLDLISEGLSSQDTRGPRGEHHVTGSFVSHGQTSFHLTCNECHDLWSGPGPGRKCPAPNRTHCWLLRLSWLLLLLYHLTQ